MLENPARWDDLKAMGFETPKELSKGNHPSLPHGQMPAFVAALRARKATAALALELLILANARTNAVLQAKWPEFDLDKALWNVPIMNLKDREHRREPFEVPLSARTIEILKEMEKARVSVYVFPGQRKDQPLSNMAFLTLLKRMNRRQGDSKIRTRSRDGTILRQAAPSRLTVSAPPSRPGERRSPPFPMPQSSTRWDTRSAARSSAPTPGRRCSTCAGSLWTPGPPTASRGRPATTRSRPCGGKPSGDREARG